MHLFYHRTIPFILLAAAGMLPVRAGAEPEPAKPQRVLVVDTDDPDSLGSAVAQLADLITAYIQRRPGHVVVATSESHRVWDAARQKAPGCQTDPACVRAAAKEAHADVVVTSAVRKWRQKFVLEMERTPADSPQAPAATTEPLKRLSSLSMNVELCLRRLFGWPDLPPPEPKPAVVAAKPPVPAETQFGPVPALVPPAPAPAPEPTPPPTSGRRRVMVLDLAVTGIETKSVAPLANLIAGEIAKHSGYDVASTEDVKRLIDAQKEKQKASCVADEACMVEISRKLEADLIVRGSVGQIGGSYVLNLNLLNPREMGKAQGAVETASRVGDLPKAVAPCLAKLFGWAGGATTAQFHLPKGKKLSFAVLDLKPTGISAETAQNLTQVLSVEVKGVEGASVVSREDIAAMLQLSATKMQLGCGDDACMAEIGGALGVDRLIAGDAGKLGETYIVNLRLIDVRHGEVENRVTETYSGDEEQLLRAVRHAGHSLLGLSRTGTGRLAVTVNQNRAAVFVDETKRGEAPLPVDALAAGQHTVRVSRDGFFDWHGDVYVDAAETTSLWAQLKERPQQWYQKWWVWTIAGVVVAGATAGTVVATRPAATTGSVNVHLP